MKKMYLMPETIVVEVKIDQNLLTSSPGVSTGSGTGDEYNDGDITYSRESEWDD